MQAPYWVSLGLILWPGITAVLHWASGLAMVPVQASTFRFAQWALSHDAIHNRFPTARTKLQAVKDMYDKHMHLVFPSLHRLTPFCQLGGLPPPPPSGYMVLRTTFAATVRH